MHHYLQAIQPHHVIITSPTVYKIQILFQKKSQKLYHQWEFIHKVNRNVFGDSNIQYHDFNNGDALTFKLQNPYWCLHNPITTKSYQVSSEMDVEAMAHAMYFSGSNETIAKSNQVPYQTIEYDDEGMFQAKLMNNIQVQIFIDNGATPSSLPHIINTPYCKSIQKQKVTLQFIQEEV